MRAAFSHAADSVLTVHRVLLFWGGGGCVKHLFQRCSAMSAVAAFPTVLLVRLQPRTPGVKITHPQYQYCDYNKEQHWV